jgi:hypothetical protein
VAGSTLRSEFDGTYYFNLKESNKDTRRLLVRMRADIAIPVSGIVIGPSINLFFFQGQQSPVPGTKPELATAVVFGIMVGFSKDWKFQYEPFL